MKIKSSRNKLITLAAIAAISIALSGIATSGETNIVVKTILVRMMCKCGGEMKPTGVCYISEPPQYPHVCIKCGTNETYKIRYPEIRHTVEQ